MIAKLFLSLGLLIFIGYVLSSNYITRRASLALSIVPLCGVGLVWSPDTANAIAASVGIGRGADLLLYCWVVVSLLITLVLHVRIRVLHREITELARAIGLQKAVTPNQPLSISKAEDTV